MKHDFSYDETLEFILYMVTGAYVIYGLVTATYNYVGNGILTLIIIFSPRAIMKLFKFNMTKFLKFLVQFFIFVSMFLGRLNGFYGKVAHWDTFLHTISGFIIFLLAYVLFIIQNNGENKNINPTLVVTYCVLFAISMTAIWEIWEFTGDRLFGLNSQGGSLTDTMKDIITGSIGPILLLYPLKSYLKGKNNKLFEDLTNVVKERKKK